MALHLPEGTVNLALHTHCGFRIVGRRERIGQLHGRWRDVITESASPVQHGIVSMDNTPIEIDWMGPFGWPRTNDVPVGFPDFPGIYLWTVEYLHGGYLIYAAGITRRPMMKRFREHTRAYLNGTYTLFNIEALRQGIRTEVWHGFWTRKRSFEKQQEYDHRKSELRTVAQQQLAAFQVFAAVIDTRPRLLERLEAAIMNSLYHQPAPISDIPDRGMMLAPRWKSELPLIVKNNISAVLHGLPDRVVI